MNVHPLPDRFTPHTVVVRVLRGAGGMGKVYAEPVSRRAFVVEEQRLVRNPAGEEVVSSTQVYCDFDDEAPPGSLVTVWPGTAGQREAEVIASGRAAHPRLPAYQTLSLT